MCAENLPNLRTYIISRYTAIEWKSTQTFLSETPDLWAADVDLLVIGDDTDDDSTAMHGNNNVSKIRTSQDEHTHIHGASATAKVAI